MNLSLLTILFWICAFFATYSYIWYPVILLLLPAREPDKILATHPTKRIAVVITARNEEGKIAGKLENTLLLKRDTFDLDLIVASDASTDGTDRIVAGYAKRGIRLVRSPKRLGKEHAQGLAIASTEADIVVFTDTGTILPDDALLHLAKAFRDPTIGAVSSVDKFVTSEGTIEGESTYVRYEMWLRDLESRFFSLVGLSGSFFAARRSVCQDWDNRVQSDFGTALSCVQHGFRAISDRRLVGYYKNLSDSSKEYQRKVRTVTRGINSLRIRLEVLNIFRYGRFSFEVFSHKVMRWATPWFLLTTFCVNATLTPDRLFYQVLFAAQLLLYTSPFIARLAPTLLRISAIRIFVYFVEVNVAIVHATLLVISGHTILTWEPSKR